MKKDIVDALISIGGKFEIKDTYSSLVWKDDVIPKPTEKEINDKIAALQSDYDSKKYQRDRKYPELGEQFDLLFKDIDSGKLSKDGGFYQAIKTVKDAHPKPS